MLAPYLAIFFLKGDVNSGSFGQLRCTWPDFSGSDGRSTPVNFRLGEQPVDFRGHVASKRARSEKEDAKHPSCAFVSGNGHVDGRKSGGGGGIGTRGHQYAHRFEVSKGKGGQRFGAFRVVGTDLWRTKARHLASVVLIKAALRLVSSRPLHSPGAQIRIVPACGSS